MSAIETPALTSADFQKISRLAYDQFGLNLPAGKETLALCRCGQSGTKPFCDGSHRQCGFSAGERAQVTEPS